MSFATGVSLVIIFVFGMLFGIAMLEIVCDRNGWPPIGQRVHAWARQNAWFSAVFLLALWTLLTHFLLNPVQ
jgi:hypothetical protein